MKKKPVRVSLKSLKDLASQTGPSQALATVVVGRLRDRGDPRKFLTVDEIVYLGLEDTRDAETLAQHLPPEWLDDPSLDDLSSSADETSIPDER